MIGDPLDLQHVGGFFTMKVLWQNHHGVLVDGRETTQKEVESKKTRFVGLSKSTRIIDRRVIVNPVKLRHYQGGLFHSLPKKPAFNTGKTHHHYCYCFGTQRKFELSFMEIPPW